MPGDVEGWVGIVSLQSSQRVWHHGQGRSVPMLRKSTQNQTENISGMFQDVYFNCVFDRKIKTTMTRIL